MTDQPLQRSGDAEVETAAALCARLREAREFLGLSQEAVARVLGIPRASLSAIETGRRKVSGLELRDLARIYRRPVDHFLGSTDTKEGSDESEQAKALYRTARHLAPADQEQVLRFAEFLRDAGQAPPSRANPR